MLHNRMALIFTASWKLNSSRDVRI